MRPVHQLVHSRTRVRPRYALMPLEGFPDSRLPTWPDARVRVLAAPALGAEFVQYLIDLPAAKRGEFTPDRRLETFHYVLGGSGEISSGAGGPAGGPQGDRSLSAGSYGLTPPERGLSIVAREAMQLLVLRKLYEPASRHERGTAFYGHEGSVEALPWADNPHARLQTLIPDDFAFDLAMNIFTFDPGFGLPVVETHVMEHGLHFMQGKGLYYLDGDWMEVERDDFIWMGPYCPQSFYATGPTPARYLYYKNVNREIPL
jgi:(S)-ureidoglycine aminohydrolase